MASDKTLTIEERAAMTEGYSTNWVYDMVLRILDERGAHGGTLLDLGCGIGNFWRRCGGRFDRYVGADVVAYDGFPSEGRFAAIDPASGNIPLPDGIADVAVSLETIEHIENPRTTFREMTRLTRPGGLIIITTPNQLSILNKVTFVVKNRHNAFQDGTGNAYPTHITALIEIDLIRMAQECGLTDIRMAYSNVGRMPGLPWHWPFGLKGRAFSENIAVSAVKPATG